MIARLSPAALRGEVTAPPSKSDAQRLLIAAWLSGDIGRVQLNGAQSADIAACVRCLHALSNPEPCLDCGDSGAVLRFLTPVAAALGGARMTGSHQLAARPMGALLHALTENGCRISGDCLPFSLSGALPGTVDIADIPDLLPLLSVLAAFQPAATRFTHAGRLRYKESDRLNGCARLICDLGGLAQAEENALLVQPRPLTGGETDARGDHRMAMAAAAAACACPQGVLLRGAECVDKSYPAFWADYKRLGGQMHVL